MPQSVSTVIARLRADLHTIRVHPRPLRFLAAKVLATTGLSRLLVIRRGPIRLRFFPTALSRTLWVDGADRTIDEEAITDLVRAGAFVVDVGANIGSLAVLAAHLVGPTGKVLAVEPNPRIAQFLEANVKLNGLRNVTVERVALGSTTGSARLAIGRRSDDQSRIAASGTEVPIRRLDDLVDPNATVGLLKVDVEGFEFEVFKGGLSVLSRTQAVYFEAWDQHFRRSGTSSAEVLELLTGVGFVVHQQDPDGRWNPTDQTEFPICVNLLARRDDVG